MYNLFYFSLFLLFTSCGKSIFVSKTTQLDNFQIGTVKDATITTSNDFVRNGFDKTFPKVFTSNQNLIDTFINSIHTGLKKLNRLDNVILDNSKDWEGFGNRMNTSSFDSSFDKCKTKYLINLSKININEVSENDLVRDHKGNTTQQSKSYAVMTAQVQIYEVTSKKLLLEFTSTGRSQITLFQYSKALKGAYQKCVDRIIKYFEFGDAGY